MLSKHEIDIFLNKFIGINRLQFCLRRVACDGT